MAARIFRTKEDGSIVVLDAYGNELERTKAEYPYSYSPITLYKKSLPVNDTRKIHTAYSDRLRQRDFKRHNELCKKYFGNESDNWDNRNRKDIESFLRDWTNNQELILVQIIEYCNESNGYPYWRFDYI